MKQKVFIVGASGNVWTELIKQIQEKDWKWLNINPTEILWVANSQNFIFDPRSIDSKILNQMRKAPNKAKKVLEKYWEKFHNLEYFLELIKKEWLEWEIIFVDVSAWKDELLNFHKKIITNSQNSLVTANKNPISLYSMEDFNILNSQYWRYWTNTTVMWWAWILNFVDERKLINDDIKTIKWVFSWTMWYIMWELEKWDKSFAQIVKDAKELWYTEPNPWDDLNWLDVARKLVILARYAWHNVNMEDVEVHPLIDVKYWELEWEDFLKAIEAENDFFEAEVKKTREKWKVLRYVWEMKYDKESWKLNLYVWIKSVSKKSDLWNLSGTANLAIVETGILKNPLPHVIKSRWAGLAVTAWAVRVDIVKMLLAWLIRR
jgi:aspartokinase/homoserine dehydrogenase 1